MTIGKRLKAERKRIKLSQTDAAEILGVDYRTIARWENDHPMPCASLVKLGEYGLNVGYILGIEDKTKPQSSFLKREGAVTIDKRTAFAFFFKALRQKDEHLQRLWIEDGLFKQISEAEAAWFLRGAIELYPSYDFDEGIKVIDYAFKKAKELENDN